MECHPWFEVSDRRKIWFRNVQRKVLLVFEQGRPLQVSPSFDNFDQFGPVSTSFDQFRPVLASLDWFISLLITSKIQYFWGGSLLLPTSVLVSKRLDQSWTLNFLKVKLLKFKSFKRCPLSTLSLSPSLTVVCTRISLVNVKSEITLTDFEKKIHVYWFLRFFPPSTPRLLQL